MAIVDHKQETSVFCCNTRVLAAHTVLEAYRSLAMPVYRSRPVLWNTTQPRVKGEVYRGLAADGGALVGG
jgi:hypothetical protein